MIITSKPQIQPFHREIETKPEFIKMKQNKSNLLTTTQNSIYNTGKKIIKEFVKSLYKIIDNKIENLTSSSTTPTTSTATPQQPPNP